MKVEIEQAEQRYRRGENIDPAQIGKMKYELLPALEKDLKAAEEGFTAKQGKSKLIKEEVDEEDIAAVVSRWTGVPVSKTAGRRSAEIAAFGRGIAPARHRSG